MLLISLNDKFSFKYSFASDKKVFCTTGSVSNSGKIDEIKNLTALFEETENEEEKAVLIDQMTALLNSLTQSDLEQIQANSTYQEAILQWETKHENYVARLDELEKELARKDAIVLWTIIASSIVVVGTIITMSIILVKRKNKKTLA